MISSSGSCNTFKTPLFSLSSLWQKHFCTASINQRNVERSCTIENIMIIAEINQLFPALKLKVAQGQDRLTFIHAKMSDHPADRWINRWRKCKIEESSRQSFCTIFCNFMLRNFLIQLLKPLFGIISATYISNLQACIIKELNIRQGWKRQIKKNDVQGLC